MSSFAETSINHHTKVQDNYHAVMRLWDTSADRRCRNCWLAFRICYCSTLKARSSLYSSCGLKTQVLLYYDPKEIGRSANTGHIMEIVAPQWCSSLIYGNIDGERRLLKTIINEQVSGVSNTCILYPSPDAPLLSEWIARRPLGSTDPVTIVALDGTYPQAIRQMKFLKNSLLEVSKAEWAATVSSTLVSDIGEIDISDKSQLAHKTSAQSENTSGENAESILYKLPLVRLDINLSAETGETGITSALAGVMNQPSGEKICTLQAIVMALRSCGEPPEICDNLLEDLNMWIAYILDNKIKLGKKNLRRIEGLSDFQPIQAVSAHMEKRAADDELVAFYSKLPTV